MVGYLILVVDAFSWGGALLAVAFCREDETSAQTLTERRMVCSLELERF